MDETNPLNIQDQGVFRKGYETSLSIILKSLSSEEIDEGRPGMDDFWLVSPKASGELMICLGSRERCSVFYQARGSLGVWAWDPEHDGDPIFAWDPGAVEKLIPARYMLLHRDAIPLITEFWESGRIADTAGWIPYNHAELDYPVDNSCGHPECQTKPAAHKTLDTKT